MAARDPRRRRAARVLTEAGAPVVSLVLLPLVVALRVEPTPRGAAWGAVGAFCFGVVPFAFVLWGVLAGRWADHHVGVREQRRAVFAFSLVSMGAGVALAAVLGAPRDLWAFLTTLLVQAALAGAVTLMWKVSLHTWVASIGATALVVVFGLPALVLWPFLVAIGWSRVELRDHTTAQTVVGAILGLTLTAVVFPPLR